MTLSGDHIHVNYVTEFEGNDLNVVKKMRTIKPKFSDESNFMRDVQVTMDENYLNHMLFQLFYKEKTYSLCEAILSLIPEKFIGGAAALKTVMNTKVWAFLFKDLNDDYPMPKPIDFRCGFSKDYLTKGHLSDNKISQVFLREGNKVDLDLHFGCGLFTYDGLSA